MLLDCMTKVKRGDCLFFLSKTVLEMRTTEGRIKFMDTIL